MYLRSIWLFGRSEEVRIEGERAKDSLGLS